VAYFLDMEYLAEQFVKLSAGFTQLVSKYPFETGILVGAAAVALVWLLVSLRTNPRGSESVADAAKSRREKKPTIEDVREKARRRL